MKKLAANTVLCMQPVPQTIVYYRDKDGKNNALVVGFTANASLDLVMVIVLFALCDRIYTKHAEVFLIICDSTFQLSQMV